MILNSRSPAHVSHLYLNRAVSPCFAPSYSGWVGGNSFRKQTLQLRDEYHRELEEGYAMYSRLPLCIPLSILALSLSARPASAHHGWGGNQDEEFELAGTVVTPLGLAGPHASMQIRASDGQVWDLTLAPPARTERAGLK